MAHPKNKRERVLIGQRKALKNYLKYRGSKFGGYYFNEKKKRIVRFTYHNSELRRLSNRKVRRRSNYPQYGGFRKIGHYEWWIF